MPSKFTLESEVEVREILSALPVLPDKKANINSAACKLASVGSMRGRYERFRADPYLAKDVGTATIKALGKTCKQAKSLETTIKGLFERHQKALRYLSIHSADVNRLRKSLALFIADIDEAISDLEHWPPEPSEGGKPLVILPAPNKNWHATTLAMASAEIFEDLTGKRATVTNPNIQSQTNCITGIYVDLLRSLWHLYNIEANIEYCANEALTRIREKSEI